MKFLFAFVFAASIVLRSGATHAQDTLSAAMTCYTDILDDWKDQDGVTGTNDYRAAISKIIPKLPVDDRTLLQARLNALSSSASNSPEMLVLYVRTCSARRAMRMASYVSKFQKVLFSQHAILGDAFFVQNLQTAAGVSGRGLELLTLTGYYGSVSHLLSGGEARHPDVSFDGTRAVFSWRGGSSGSNDYHLYEMDLATHTTRQLTFGSGIYTVDLDPCYLPGGDICFVSSRYAQELDCTSGKVTNLMLCNKDGKYLRQIGFDQVHILYPRVMPSGEVSYCRWDYNDKTHFYAHAVFTMNPDGTAQRELCNNNSWWPTMILQQRPIPNTTKMMAMIGGYHSRQWGKIGIIDPNIGTQNGQGVTLVAPVRLPKDDNLCTWGNPNGGVSAWLPVDAAVFPKPGAAPLDKWGQDRPLFAYPYPFDANAFLVSFQPAFKETSWKMGLYFMTVDGQRELLFHDNNGDCMGAVAALPRPVPPVLSSTVNYRDSMGTCQVMKINLGQSLPGVADGVITRLRVVQLYFRPGPVVDGEASYLHTGSGSINTPFGATYHTAIAIQNASWDAKWIVGETPVQSDGSASFKVPAHTPIFFQALNAKGQVVQTMRSWATLQPGETFTCMGCHESRLSPPPPLTYVPIALKQPPLPLEPFYGPGRGFSFEREVQPILDARCVSCHSGTVPKGGLSLSALPRVVHKVGTGMFQSYLNLVNHKDFESKSKYVSWCNAEESPILQPPYRAGSYRSRLDSILEKGHSNLTLTDREMRTIRCWIDLNVPYWGRYQDGHPGSEANLTIREQWLTQEKKNIADYLLTVGIDSDGRGGGTTARADRAGGFALSCVALRGGAVRLRLVVPEYAAGKTVRVAVYNVKGSLVRTCLNKRVGSGKHELMIRGLPLSSGNYVVCLQAAGHERTAPLLVMR